MASNILYDYASLDDDMDCLDDCLSSSTSSAPSNYSMRSEPDNMQFGGFSDNEDGDRLNFTGFNDDSIPVPIGSSTLSESALNQQLPVNRDITPPVNTSNPDITPPVNTSNPDITVPANIIHNATTPDKVVHNEVDLTPACNISAEVERPKLVVAYNQKDKHCIVYLPYGHRYNKNQKGKGRSKHLQHWRCVNHQKEGVMCKALLRTSLNYEESLADAVLHGPAHCCTPLASALQNLRVIKTAKDEGKKNPHKPAKEIGDAAVEKEFPSSIPQEHLISEKLLHRRVNYARRDDRIRPPGVNEDLVLYDLKTAGFESDFFLSDVIATRKQDTRRHFLFASPKQLELLRKATNMKMDATFKICKEPHKQLLTIHSTIYTNIHPNGKTIPLFYALMSGKRTVDYVEVLKELKKFLLQGGNSIMLKDVMMDYEIGMWTAIEKVFGADVKKRGCWFHFTQAIFRRISELKLTNDYYKKDRVYIMARRFMTLALMDEANIPVLYEHLKKC